MLIAGLTEQGNKSLHCQIDVGELIDELNLDHLLWLQDNFQTSIVDFSNVNHIFSQTKKPIYNKTLKLEQIARDKNV